MIDHINIVVRDLGISAHFYEHVFDLERGFTATLEGDWIAQVTGLADVRAHCLFLAAPDGDTRIELLQYETPSGEAFPLNSRPNTYGLRHFALTCDDLDALLARLHELGVKPLSAPVEVPFKVGNLGRKRLCYFHDPDGTLLEAAAYD